MKEPVEPSVEELLAAPMPDKLKPKIAAFGLILAKAMMKKKEDDQ